MGERATIYLHRALAVFALALSGYFIVSYWPFTLDDSFITFRYAMNLASGHGPVFNPGLSPAEGYTSFLWVLLTAIPHLLGINAEIFSKVSGVLAFGATLYFSYRFVCDCLGDGFTQGERKVAGMLALALNAAFYAGASHVVSGMETSFYTAFLTAFLYFIHRSMAKGEGRDFLYAGVLGLLAGLTRPEGNLAVCVAFAAAVVLSAKGAGRARAIKSGALYYALPYAVYFAWRFYYYGHLFPLTFYVKVSHTPLTGLPEVLSFLNYLGARVGILVIAGMAVYGRAMLPSILAVVSLLVFFIFPDHSVQGFNFRFLYPLVPFIFVLAAMGAAVFIRSVGAMVRDKGMERMVLAVAVAICVLSPLVFIKGYSGNVRMSIGLYEGNLLAHLPLGKRLAAFSTNRTPVLAISDAGVVPYYSGWRIIDTWSLNDEHIVMSRTRDPEYVLGQNPDALVLVAKSANKFVPYHSWATDLYNSALKRGLYPVKKLAFSKGRDGFWLWVLARPGTPLWDHLSNWDGK